ncbi:hypothetical protein COLO4_25229 [Corchorus olitorius]|uniref:Uncharacterized protein n=1 Tax=Corchorus olitorius TaxID=93759 RepID=A0A1R3I416_9ROSI|nr:hypothetical protein COLO4_25229 [Corchorus olitorius]
MDEGTNADLSKEGKEAAGMMIEIFAGTETMSKVLSKALP